MQWPRTLTIILLLAIGLALAITNVWFTAARSTIPLRLEGVVTSKEIRHEKHPGKDDVFLLTLDSRPAFQVDAPIYHTVSFERLHKAPWSRQLHHGKQRLDLRWSRDCRGMLLAMAALALIFLATCGQQRKATSGS